MFLSLKRDLVLEAMVVETSMPGLLSLLESYARTTTLEVLMVPRPPTPILPPPPQNEPAKKKNGKGRSIGTTMEKVQPRRERSKKKHLPSIPKQRKQAEPNKEGEVRISKRYLNAALVP